MDNNVNIPPALLGLSTGRFAPRIELCGQDGHLALMGFGHEREGLVREVLLAQLRSGGGLIHLDAHLDQQLLSDIHKEAEQQGRKLWVLDFSAADGFLEPGAAAMARVSGYNPLAYGDAGEVASRLVNALAAPEVDNPGADYYASQMSYMLAHILQAWFERAERGNVQDLARLLCDMQALDALSKDHYALGVVLQHYRDPATGELSEKALRTVFGGLVGRLLILGAGLHGEIFRPHGPWLDVASLIQRGELLVIRLNVMGRDQGARTQGQLVLAEILGALQRIRRAPESLRPRTPFLIHVDLLFGEGIPRQLPLLLNASSEAGVCVLWSLDRVPPAAQGSTLATLQQAWSRTSNALVFRARALKEACTVFSVFEDELAFAKAKASGQGLLRSLRKGSISLAPEKLLALELGQVLWLAHTPDAGPWRPTPRMAKLVRIEVS